MSDALDHVIAERSLDELRCLYKTLLLDSCHTEVEIDALAARVLDRDWLNGDSYGVPDTIQIVERLVQEIERLRK